MHVADLPNSDLAGRDPDGTEVILDRPYAVSGRIVSRLELRLYSERRRAGSYCTITAYAEIDGHTIETVYDEGYRGRTPAGGRRRVHQVRPGPRQPGAPGGHIPGRGAGSSG